MIADVYANTTGCTFLLQIGSEKTDISLLLNIDKILLLSYVFGPQLEQSITVLRHKEIWDTLLVIGTCTSNLSEVSFTMRKIESDFFLYCPCTVLLKLQTIYLLVKWLSVSFLSVWLTL